MKRIWKKSIALIVVFVMCMGLLSTTAFAVEDNIVVIREDVEIEDLTVDGELYVAEGAHLVTTGEASITGDVYLFGSWRNTGTVSGEGTIHCLHYNSMSFAVTANGHFTNVNSSGGPNQSLSVYVNNSYLSMTIPEGHTYDPETGETTGPESEDEPDSEPEDEPDTEPEDTTDSEPEDTTDSEPEDTTDSEPEDTTDSEPEDTTGSGTESTAGSGTESTTASGTRAASGSAEHTYDFDNIVWEWMADYSAANAFVYCVDGDGAAKAYEAEIESYSNEYGGVTYVASIMDEDGNTYTNTIVLDAAGNPIDVESSEGGTDTGSSGTGSTAGTTSGDSSTSSGDSSNDNDSGSGSGSSGSGSTGSSGTGSTGSSGSGSTGSSGTGYTGSTGSGSTGSSGSGYTGSSGSGYTGSSGTGTAAKTDDSAMPYLYLTLFLAAGAAVVTFSVRRRVTR